MNEKTILYDKKGNFVTELRQEGFEKIYIIIVTAENFGALACDLSLLLEKP